MLYPFSDLDVASSHPKIWNIKAVTLCSIRVHSAQSNSTAIRKEHGSQRERCTPSPAPPREPRVYVHLLSLPKRECRPQWLHKKISWRSCLGQITFWLYCGRVTSRWSHASQNLSGPISSHNDEKQWSHLLLAQFMACQIPVCPRKAHSLSILSGWDNGNEWIGWGLMLRSDSAAGSGHGCHNPLTYTYVWQMMATTEETADLRAIIDFTRQGPRTRTCQRLLSRLFYARRFDGQWTVK